MEIEREKELVEKAKESLEAFDELYNYYLPRIYSYALNRTGRKSVAEDIVSQTFLKAMTKIRTFNYRGFTFGAWLYRIAHNSIVDYARKHKYTRNMPEEESNTLSTSKQGIDQDQLERQEIVLKALQTLPTDCQQILTLRFFQELSNEEIADIVGCKKTTLAVRMHRSLKSLKQALIKNGYTIDER